MANNMIFPFYKIDVRTVKCAFIFLLILFAFNFSMVSEADAASNQNQFETIEWTDLMPKADLDALMNPPSYVTDIEDGSSEDKISSQFQGKTDGAEGDRYQQALSSTQVISDVDGKKIRIAGFIVPLEFNDDQTVTQFFLVPFFGACIHVPPPPPNQIIFVKYPKGINLEALYDPFWVSGVLKTSVTKNDTATSAYTMNLHEFEPYNE